MTKNILALLDFSEITAEVVARAGELAGFYNAKCWLIHVAAPDPDFVGYDVGPKYIRDDRADVLRQEHRQLQEYKSMMEQKGVDCEALLVQGNIHATIESEIEKLDMDMVVMGSHGHSRLHELLVGSVCEHMLRKSKVPMMVIPAK